MAKLNKGQMDMQVMKQTNVFFSRFLVEAAFPYS